MQMQGARKTKLGLREFVTLGNFEQVIDITSNKAVSLIYLGQPGHELHCQIIVHELHCAQTGVLRSAGHCALELVF